MTQGSSFQRLAREAKANGRARPFVTVRLRMCTRAKRAQRASGKPEYSHITQEKMKRIMKNAVEHVYRLLSLKENDPGKYEVMIDFGSK
jgi:hypothetical protein